MLDQVEAACRGLLDELSLTPSEAADRPRGPRASQRVGGGDINHAFRVAVRRDESFAFVKTRADVAPGEYAAEAAGLRWLAEPGALRVPEVPAASPTSCSCSTGSTRARRGDPAAFGAGLAAVHAAGADDVRRPRADCGSARSRSRTTRRPTGRRSTPSTACARSLKHLGPSGRGAVERVCDRIADLAGPPEPPARLHGDLWSGNVLWDRQGRAWLIDPAAYGGHREVDLAMLRLFGDPGRHFFAAYDERFPLAPGHEERVPLYQLFPLLVHAALFGGGYAASAERAASLYA